MKKTILFLLLAWIAIYAGNHLLFKSVPKNSEVETALRSQTDSERREIELLGAVSAWRSSGSDAKCRLKERTTHPRRKCHRKGRSTVS